MTQPLQEFFAAGSPELPEDDRDYVPQIVNHLLTKAREAAATDIHLVPTADAVEMSWRVDGLLHHVHRFSESFKPRLVARLKVMSGLLTYQCETPQEGRIRADFASEETRVSTFPTLYGEKVVIRLFALSGHLESLEQLSLPQEILESLRIQLAATSGIILLTGPCGSGKTTTIYACLRAMVAASQGQRSLCSLEDPIEVVIPGVSQSQVKPEAEFHLDNGLRSLMRQDPEVIAVGEIRDRSTAEAVFQAALTGHLVLTTFHAGSAAGCVSRLLDMGIEPYLLRSTVRAILSQRLLRSLCAACREPSNRSAFGVETTFTANGCDACRGTGYSGRQPIAELLLPDQSETARAILDRSDTTQLQSRAVASGMVPLEQRVRDLLAEGQTSADEAMRVLGPGSDELG